jgi:plastocyanin
MQATIFYIFGGLLVVSAVVTAFFGLRNEESFPSPAQLRGLLAYFTVLVVGTMTFAVLNSNANPEEREHNAEAAAKLRETDRTRGEQEADDPGGETLAGSPPAAVAKPSAAPSGPAQMLKLTSPASGAIEYAPTSLKAKPGTVTIDYNNPSSVPHSVAIEDSGGKTLNASQVGAHGDFKATADLVAGTYTYYCTVPGHREAGMKGTLTVK